MKVIDEKGRLFGKLNVIDLLALLLAAVGAARPQRQQRGAHQRDLYRGRSQRQARIL